MKKQLRLLTLLFMTLFILSPTPGHAQKKKEISLSVYPGFTLVNFEKALGYSDDYMDDWDQFHLAVALRGFLVSGTTVDLGAEIAWQKLYYAYYRVPYGTSPVYREFYISTFSFTALGKYSKNNFFALAGAGLHFFNDGVAPSLTLETGLILNKDKNLSFPVSVRLNPVFGDGTPVPVSLGVGARYVL